MAQASGREVVSRLLAVLVVEPDQEHDDFHDVHADLAGRQVDRLAIFGSDERESLAAALDQDVVDHRLQRGIIRVVGELLGSPLLATDWLQLPRLTLDRAVPVDGGQLTEQPLHESSRDVRLAGRLQLTAREEVTLQLCIPIRRFFAPGAVGPLDEDLALTRVVHDVALEAETRVILGDDEGEDVRCRPALC